MTHWGWYWKVKNRGYEPRSICEGQWLCEIDSFSMFNDYKKAEEVRESPEKLCLEIPGYKLKAYLQDDDSILVKHKGIAYVIPVERKPCNFGGYYYFFHCPRCQKRMRKLYCVDGYYMCRGCNNLAYYSQRVRPTIRFRIAASEVKQYIKRRGGNLELNEKPPRMHRKTFERLAAKERYFNSRSELSSTKELRSWYGAKIEEWLLEGIDYEHEYNVEEYQKKYQRKSR